MVFKIAKIQDVDIKELVDVLNQDKPVCAPTDTIYGLLAKDSLQALEYLYKIRRPSKKPFLRLLPDLSYLSIYGLKPNEFVYELSNVKGVSIVLKAQDKDVGFRVPKSGFIKNILDEFKYPILAPSCNKEGEPPAKSIEEAIGYFADEVPLYIDAGVIEATPSTIVEISNRVSILREGASIDAVKNLLSRYDINL